LAEQVKDDSLSLFSRDSEVSQISSPETPCAAQIYLSSNDKCRQRYKEKSKSSCSLDNRAEPYYIGDRRPVLESVAMVGLGAQIADLEIYESAPVKAETPTKRVRMRKPCETEKNPCDSMENLNKFDHP